MHLSEYKHKSIAIDGYAWLHKSVFSCCVELAMDNHSDKWINYCIRLVEMLLSCEINVYLVFDRSQLPAKLNTELNRHSYR